ncbi:EFR1 family ferrodoxin [Clostridium sp. BJN0013]|uniref:EFR1 family ferrodoxin n=1 Tax=Clostridium sp. BJN0013 TaxID=3236840 RepID=UPI0034C636BA
MSAEEIVKIAIEKKAYIMNPTIYYFSATGNSLTIARQIAKGLGNCIIKSMAVRVTDEPVGGPDNPIGFVFPVFYIGLPRLVKRFVQNLNIVKGTYCFAFINFGGNGADTLGMLDDILKEKGVCLSYSAGVKMPGNYIVKYQAFAPDVVQKLIKNAMEKADEAAEAVAGGKLQPVRRKARLLSKIANCSYLYKGISEWDKKFEVSEKCSGCGLCARVCPVNNIKMEDRNPVWQHHCERCLACIQWCPYEAIEYGRKTIGRRRYHNPNVKVEDIIKGSTCKNI